jgi:predicted flap endonuclease-1-like 5' DNA nuclease
MTKPATGYDLSKVEIRTIDWGRRLNKSQVRALYQANVRTLKDAVDKDRDGLTAIKGVGEKIADTLLEEAVRLSSE